MTQTPKRRSNTDVNRAASNADATLDALKRQRAAGVPVDFARLKKADNDAKVAHAKRLETLTENKDFIQNTKHSKSEQHINVTIDVMINGAKWQGPKKGAGDKADLTEAQGVLITKRDEDGVKENKEYNAHVWDSAMNSTIGNQKERLVSDHELFKQAQADQALGYPDVALRKLTKLEDYYKNKAYEQEALSGHAKIDIKAGTMTFDDVARNEQTISLAHIRNISKDNNGDLRINYKAINGVTRASDLIDLTQKFEYRKSDTIVDFDKSFGSIRLANNTVIRDINWGKFKYTEEVAAVPANGGNAAIAGVESTTTVATYRGTKYDLDQAAGMIMPGTVSGIKSAENIQAEKNVQIIRDLKGAISIGDVDNAEMAFERVKYNDLRTNKVLTQLQEKARDPKKDGNLGILQAELKQAKDVGKMDREAAFHRRELNTAQQKCTDALQKTVRDSLNDRTQMTRVYRGIAAEIRKENSEMVTETKALFIDMNNSDPNISAHARTDLGDNFAAVHTHGHDYAWNSMCITEAVDQTEKGNYTEVSNIIKNRLQPVQVNALAGTYQHAREQFENKRIEHITNGLNKSEDTGDYSHLRLALHEAEMARNVMDYNHHIASSATAPRGIGNVLDAQGNVVGPRVGYDNNMSVYAREKELDLMITDPEGFISKGAKAPERIKDAKSGIMGQAADLHKSLEGKTPEAKAVIFAMSIDKLATESVRAQIDEATRNGDTFLAFNLGDKFESYKKAFITDFKDAYKIEQARVLKLEMLAEYKAILKSAQRAEMAKAFIFNGNEMIKSTGETAKRGFATVASKALPS